MINLSFQRAAEVIPRTGLARATFFSRIKQQLWTPPVPLGPNSSGWPAHEVDALIAARLAGKSDDEIRAIVSNLVTKRGEIIAELGGAFLGPNGVAA